VEKKMKLKFEFCYPPTVFGTYDTGDGTIYMFGNIEIDLFPEALSHEILHFVVQKIEGKHASLALDLVPHEWLV